ncbi:MAG: superoxide dismutase family protein [Bacillus sp. (in: firmicutes)]
MKKIGLAIGVLLLASGCAEENVKEKDIDMVDKAGDSLGTIKLTQNEDSMDVEVDLAGLKPGTHGIHFHEKGVCKGPDFISAGDHFNPEDKEHGLMNDEGSHAGDMPNLTVGDDGTVKVTLHADVTFEEEHNALMTRDGASIIVHEKADDGMTQPAGDAGRRTACGIVSEEKE